MHVCICSVPYRYSAHTRIGSPCIRIRAGPYTYGPARTDIAGNPCFAHMRISARMRISMLDHLHLTTADIGA